MLENTKDCPTATAILVTRIARGIGNTSLPRLSQPYSFYYSCCCCCCCEESINRRIIIKKQRTEETEGVGRETRRWGSKERRREEGEELSCQVRDLICLHSADKGATRWGKIF
jgi:hypothetical protein